MKKLNEHRVTLPELALVAGTRVMLGVGIGLLVANRLDNPKRKVLGRTLLLLGAASTLPLAMKILGRG